MRNSISASPGNFHFCAERQPPDRVPIQPPARSRALPHSRLVSGSRRPRRRPGPPTRRSIQPRILQSQSAAYHPCPPPTRQTARNTAQSGASMSVSRSSRKTVPPAQSGSPGIGSGHRPVGFDLILRHLRSAARIASRTVQEFLRNQFCDPVFAADDRILETLGQRLRNVVTQRRDEMDPIGTQARRTGLEPGESIAASVQALRPSRA